MPANPYTSLTAGPSMLGREQAALVANPELIGLERKRKMAELLLAQGLKGQPEGQMVSGYYVPPSWAQRLSPVLDRLMGEQGLKDVDEKTAKLAEQLRRKEIEDVKKFYEYQFGTPAQQMEMAGPYGAGVGMGGQDVPMPTVETSPAVSPNIPAAIELGSTSTSPLVRQQLAEMLKPQKLSEGEVVTRLNPNTGKYETVTQGGARTRAPVSVGNYLVDPQTGRVIFQAPEKPQAGQVVEREDGTYLVNTRTGQATPVVGPQGQPLTGGKPLNETQSNAVAFGARAIEANKIATELENKGVVNTGVIRTAIGGTAGMTPIIGERLEQGVRSTFNVLPQALGGPSPEQQQNEQARRNFISAVLRKESGATIRDDEYRNEEKKYFPQLGDSAAVIKQKQEARELAIKALQAQAGPSGKRQIEAISGGTQGKVIDFNQLPTGR